jgi:hypothetical protein
MKGVFLGWLLGSVIGTAAAVAVTLALEPSYVVTFLLGMFCGVGGSQAGMLYGAEHWS